ncbi:AhpC/Tsa family protein GSU0066 [hydrothermal vent metagenome]|uniref:thioredoxin-dependent peroxiredoxin n=1 Tax=hydrothermal vent metagenome TaxID=652676 RepID=A0A3B1AEG5_9ZZZZ
MTLRQQTQQLTEQFISSQAEQTQQDIMESFEQLMSSDTAQNALKIGDDAIDFTLPNAAGEQKKLSNMLQQGPIVLSFYRGGWCPYCNLQFKALNDILPEIKQLGANLIGVSPETPDSSMSTVEKHQLQFEVLSDIGNNIADKYGLVMTVIEKMRPYYLQWGFDIPALNGDDSYQLPVPATYIIDRNQKITECYVNKNYTERMEPSDIISALKNL